jgi:hypothetical protein
MYMAINVFEERVAAVAVSTKMAVFWVVAPCSLVEVYQRFRGPCCLHHQGDEYIKDGFEVLTAVAVFWVVSGCTHRPDDGGSKDL